MKKNQTWDKHIHELRRYFSSIDLPDDPILIDNVTVIEDVKLFVNSHFEMIEANNGNPKFASYIQRLYKLKSILENQHEAK